MKLTTTLAAAVALFAAPADAQFNCIQFENLQTCALPSPTYLNGQLAYFLIGNGTIARFLNPQLVGPGQLPLGDVWLHVEQLAIFESDPCAVGSGIYLWDTPSPAGPIQPLGTIKSKGWNIYTHKTSLGFGGSSMTRDFYFNYKDWWGNTTGQCMNAPDWWVLLVRVTVQ